MHLGSMIGAGEYNNISLINIIFHLLVDSHVANIFKTDGIIF